MTKEKNPCPYKSLSDSAYWRRSVTNVNPKFVDPIVNVKFKITKEDKVATAGSCFAQHISRYMRNSGFNYYIAEKGHNILSEKTTTNYNYGTFSARYGNIYTTRQLLQTVKRAYGLFKPEDDCWEDGNIFVDPFRPYIQPDGFATQDEFYVDREQHFAGIQSVIESSDVFVFTLGLTEMWFNAEDGAVYPVCPGCGVGEYEPKRHKFHNLTVDEVITDLREFIELYKEKNPKGKVLLTVSPVPLIATQEDHHVLTSTTYSKAVLRVAAQAVVDQYNHVDYFPSFEIITGNFSRGRYYEDDLREINEIGVNHAMSCFFQHYLDTPIERLDFNTPCTSTKNAYFDKTKKNNEGISERINRVICDEERLEENI